MSQQKMSLDQPRTKDAPVPSDLMTWLTPKELAALLGARGTPTFFLNGQLIVGARPFEVFEAAIERELKKVSASGKTKP